jgi:hypothetical protein
MYISPSKVWQLLVVTSGVVFLVIRAVSLTKRVVSLTTPQSVAQSHYYNRAELMLALATPAGVGVRASDGRRPMP